ncbi:Ferredoxin [Micromonospora narathiwatensis]|uniref:Ferredoxin n=1 Tax=Micromonospora narathiwatensis TaxID=299146 RepID=A0A1A8ZMB2_9ACTN|nr:ferredoxin [Micromonospora narathiwatensis]SBT45027.1 Ferredoxin [Micromonospora narathiwatensis]
MRVRVDRDRCCGSGNCVVTAPEVFDQGDEDGLVLLRFAEPAPDVVDRVRRAVDLCPAGAISLDEPPRRPDQATFGGSPVQRT